MRDQPILTHIIIAVLILAVFYFIYYKPKGKELQNIKAERIKIEGDVEKSKKKKRELDKIEAELESMNVTLRNLEVIIPQKKEIYNILRKIQQLANDSKLNVRRFAVQKEKPQEFYSIQEINIEMAGNYHNLGHFFDELSHFSRLFNVDNFSMKTLARQSSTATISITCVPKTYIFHDEKVLLERAKTKKGKKRR
jgi:type IV pilus assembly protein PilO